MLIRNAPPVGPCRTLLLTSKVLCSLSVDTPYLHTRYNFSVFGCLPKPSTKPPRKRLLDTADCT